MIATRTPDTALASVIVPCFNQLEYTRHCVASLCRHTGVPWELVAVNNGSSDGTGAYLQGVQDAASFPVCIISNPQNQGFPGACNQGLREARGRYCVLLSNDTVLTDSWLNQLIALAESQPDLGAVGPMANDAAPPQLVENVPYRDLEEMHRFAAQWRAERRGQWFEVQKLSGFCLILKREVLQAVGPLDERFGVGFLDDDLSLRVRQAGFKLAVAHDLFVHRSAAWAPSSRPARPTHVQTVSSADFAGRFGTPDTSRALCGYTTAADTEAVLTLLVHAQPRRVLEIGTPLGHMTANLTEWTAEEAQIFTLGIVQGMESGGAAEQSYEIPPRGEFGSLANHFGKAQKVLFITADSRAYDFQRLAPLDFIFIDGGHDLDIATSDTRKAYEALAPGGWLVWHDFESPLPWIRVRQAIEQLCLPETVIHVEGTQVAFLQKGAPLASRSSHREPLRAVWEGDPAGLHSLGLINRAFCRALLDRGYGLGLDPGGTIAGVDRLPRDPQIEARVGRRPSTGPIQVHISHRWPPRLEPPPEGRWVFMQPWEFGSLPRAWLPALERVDEVWAYSGYVRDCYLEAGVPPERVAIVPLGVDPAVFRPGQTPLALPPGPDVRFLFVGGTIYRKGIDVLLDAFARAFRPNDGVGLVVQDMGTKSFYRGQTAGPRIADLREQGYPVEYRDAACDQAALASLYAGCDCLVHPYRGEGFALPVAEAMACGLPVIVTGAGPVTRLR